MPLKRIFIFSLFALQSLTTHGQSVDAVQISNSFVFKNSINTEFFGNGLVYAFNYERVLFNKQRFKTTGQIGFAFYPPTFDVDFTIPVLLTELISFDKHHIEIGIGCLLGFDPWNDYASTDDAMWGIYTGRIGYRYQKPDGRFTYKIAFTPFVSKSSYDGSFDFSPWGGCSFGYNFGKK